MCLNMHANTGWFCYFPYESVFVYTCVFAPIYISFKNTNFHVYNNRSCNLSVEHMTYCLVCWIHGPAIQCKTLHITFPQSTELAKISSPTMNPRFVYLRNI